MSHQRPSPWLRPDAANDNDRENRVTGREVVCDLPEDLGIIEGEVDLLTRFFDRIMAEAEAANDNESEGET